MISCSDRDLSEIEQDYGSVKHSCFVVSIKTTTILVHAHLWQTTAIQIHLLFPKKVTQSVF